MYKSEIEAGKKRQKARDRRSTLNKEMGQISAVMIEPTVISQQEVDPDVITGYNIINFDLLQAKHCSISMNILVFMVVLGPKF